MWKLCQVKGVEHIEGVLKYWGNRQHHWVRGRGARLRAHPSSVAPQQLSRGPPSETTRHLCKGRRQVPNAPNLFEDQMELSEAIILRGELEGIPRTTLTSRDRTISPGLEKRAGVSKRLLQVSCPLSFFFFKTFDYSRAWHLPWTAAWAFTVLLSARGEHPCSCYHAFLDVLQDD